MKDLEKEIKAGSFQPVYLLFGDEDYLRLQYKKKLYDALNPEGDTMNVTSFSGKDISQGEIIDLAETMPFFAERRVIFVEDSGFFKNKCEELPDYIGHLPDYLVLVFVETEVDKRGRMYKAVNKNGRATEFKSQSEATLKTWVFRRLKAEKKNITEPDLEYFLSRTGSDMCRISTELEKLLAYALEEDVITREAIAAITSENLENHIFDMVDAIAAKRKKRALELYYDLLALKEAPLKILALIARQYRIMLKIGELSAGHMSAQDMAAKLGLHPFAVKKSLPLARKYKPRQLRQAIEEMALLEEDVKNGRIKDSLAVELLIVRYSS